MRGVHPGDAGVRVPGHEQLHRGQDDAVSRADHRPGRDRLPGRDAPLLAQRDRRERLWVAASTRASRRGRPLAKQAGNTLCLK